MATHTSVLPWEIPWTEEPGRLQSWGGKRVGHDLVTKITNSDKFIPFYIATCFQTLIVTYHRHCEPHCIYIFLLHSYYGHQTKYTVVLIMYSSYGNALL